MKRLWPDSIAGWTVATIIVGLLASQLLSFAVHFRERGTVIAALQSFHVGERIADAVRVLKQTPPTQRPHAAERFNGSTMWIDWEPQFPIVGEGRDWRADMLRAAVIRNLSEGDWRGLRVALIQPQQPPAREERAGRPSTDSSLAGGSLAAIERKMETGPLYGVAVQIQDGTWLNFVVPFVGAVSYWSKDLIVALGLSVVVVAILSLLAVRYITAPLSALARAAAQFGVSIDAAEPPLRGSREIRSTIAAFNEMRQRIKRYVEDRMQMMAAISHDLRTPITRLRLRAEFVEDEEQQRKMLADLDEMESMISAVLSFARAEIVVETRRPLDLAALLREICADMRQHGHAVTLAEHGPILFVGRPSALRRCFVNLITNAVKYGGGARVGVTSREREICVSIEDDGPGIPESEQEKVFRPFYRIESSRSRDTGGTGLGLTVARTVARGHGGDIVLENRAEGGLSVRVMLPTGRADAEASPPEVPARAVG
ncbi:MAG: HAMP domain-containing protein [Rhodospirillaceae bacterium]|nr:HAMP domain-containing protein [Rhodospirillaceae bacterium]